jgi:dolichol-phosphate mannosyltransferase
MHYPITSFSLVIPTYNGRDDIREFLEQVHLAVEPLGSPYEVIVVDDDSLDETWQVAASYSASYPVRVLRRNGKKGLAAAIVEGIKASDYEIVVVTGADLRRSAEIIPQLVAEVCDGKDVVVGSRFVEPGASERPRLFGRIAKDTDLLARTLFRQIRSIKNLKSDFFAIRKDVVAHANLNPVGNRILLEILVQGAYTTVSEIPYRDEKRKAGTNKVGVTNALDYVWHLCGLFRRSGELHRFLKFCAVGGAGAVLNLAVLYVLTELGVFYLLSGFVAIEAGLLSNFVLNRSWTFKDRGMEGLRFVLTALYRDHAVRFVGIILNLVILWLLTSVFGLYYLLSQLIGIGVAMLWNYGGNQWWTWEPV